LGETKMIQMTPYCPPGEKVDTQYGIVRYEEWLNRESARICRHPGRTAEIDKKASGTIALWVNDVVERGVFRWGPWAGEE